MPRRRSKDVEPPIEMPTMTNSPTQDDIARRAYQLYQERGGDTATIGMIGSKRKVNCDEPIRDAAMSPLDSLILRIRGEYVEMPGLCLTFAQACRLWQVDATTCQSVLDTLLSETFLARRQDGSFIARHSHTPRPQSVKAVPRPLASYPVLRRSA